MIKGLGGTTTELDALDVSDAAPDTADPLCYERVIFV